MKKVYATILSISLIAAILAGCGSQPSKSQPTEPQPTEPQPAGDGGAFKPVIYLYGFDGPVQAGLDLSGNLTCTYPQIGDDNVWNVQAKPDGTLTDTNGQKYNYLYWEGEHSADYDFSTGYCVKGSETADFLEGKLKELGLNRKEANEFIVYWLPQMQGNPYNVISFQTDRYTDVARLDVKPAPDSTIRVFMTWYPSDKYVDIQEQKIATPARFGKTVVEWGGDCVL